MLVQTPRIIVDDRPLRRTLTGVGSYVAQLLRALPSVAPELCIEPFVLRYVRRRRDWQRALEELIAPPTDGAPGAAPTGADITARRSWWQRDLLQRAYGVYFRLRSRGARLQHETNHIPVASGLPTVTTIHDLSGILFPEWHPADRVRWYEREFSRGVAQTRHFLAVSEFTRQEIMRVLHVPAERITATPLAARDAFRPQPAESCAAACRGAGLPTQFFLFVGTLEPRKNVAGLLEAYAALPASLRARVPLAIAGAWGWKAEALRERLRAHDLAGQVHLLGYQNDVQLAALYSACTALVWPTFYEGFGLPPLEALACGAAVIVSDVASLPEVVGSAGVRLDPRRIGAWTEAMRRVAEDEAWREALRAAGPAQAARFSWRRCAEQTAAVYRAACEPGGE